MQYSKLDPWSVRMHTHCSGSRGGAGRHTGRVILFPGGAGRAAIDRRAKKRGNHVSGPWAESRFSRYLKEIWAMPATRTMFVCQRLIAIAFAVLLVTLFEQLFR
ncbi:MAG: hypothetical protein RIB80_18015 [Rhodospirillales bacterium]